MLAELSRLRAGPDVEIGVAIGCLVPLATMLAVATGIGVVNGAIRGQSSMSADHVVVRAIGDGAPRGRQILSTQVVSLR